MSLIGSHEIPPSSLAWLEELLELVRQQARSTASASERKPVWDHFMGTVRRFFPDSEITVLRRGDEVEILITTVQGQKGFLTVHKSIGPAKLTAKLRRLKLAEPPAESTQHSEEPPKE